MNKIHRLIWNEVAQVWVAVAEIAQGRSKRSGTVTRIALPEAILLPNLTTLALCLALTAAALPGSTFAQTASTQLPTGGNVVAGTASITQNAAVMNINQTSNRAAIDWNTFNVGSAAQVNFNQSSSSSVTLNRVLDSNPSQIFGRITAPGQVFLVNPNGVFFAPGASVDVGGLVATTHRIGVDDFMAGKSTFERNGATGSVVNAGELKAALGGYITLLAPQVRNDGVIVAQAGTVALASGEAITLNFGDNGTLAGITATQSQIAALVENKNAVFAPGGLIILSAMAVNSLQGGVITHSGTLSASSLTEKGGRILLEGDHISLTSGSQITATGASGGGEVLVGGDWQGGANTEHRVFGDPNAMKQATTVTMEAGASIDVSAIQNGNGGTAVLWSDVRKSESVTAVAGTIRAKGGNLGGNGGFVETSGARLDIADSVHLDTQAPTGATGKWLLDPVDITIAASGGNVTGSAITTALGTTSVTLNTAGTCTNVTCSTLTGTAGDIHVNDAITWGANTLTLSANNNINVNAVLNASGGGNLTLVYGGKLTMQRNDAANSFTGKINLDSSSVVNINNELYTVISSIANFNSIGTDSTSLLNEYVLGGDLDFSSGALATLESDIFRGKLDGLGHIISNYSFNTAHNWEGLFDATQNASIQNIGLKGGIITSSSNHINVGSLIGLADAGTVVKNSFSTNSINISGVSSSNYGGLIGYATGANIDSSYYTGAVAASNNTTNVGGFIGNAVGGSTINNSYSSGSISAASTLGGFVGNLTNSTITNSYSTASVTTNASSTGSNVGGLVGTVTSSTTASTISRSYATGAVASLLGSFNGNVGGLVGSAQGTSASFSTNINKSYATGSVNADGGRVGGFVGNILNYTYISDSYARGAATGTVEVGGLIGGISSATATNSVSNSYSTGIVTAIISNGGGLIGGSAVVNPVTNSFWDVQTSLLGTAGLTTGSAGGTGKTTADMKTLATFTGASWDFSGETVNGTTDIWRLNSADNNGYPCLAGVGSCNAAVAYLRLITGSSVYGATPNLTYGLFDASSAGTLISDASPTGTVTWSTVLSNTSAANTYSLTYGSGIALGSTAYSLQAGAAANWTINTAPLTVTASNASKTYDGLAYTGGNGVTYSGFVNSQTATVLGGTLGYAGTSQGATNAGSYVITPNGLTSSNYSLTFVNGTLTVNAATSTTTTATSAASPVIVPPVVNVAPTGSSGTSSDVSVGQTGSNGISISIDQDSTSGLDQSETRTVMLTVSLPSEMATAGNGFSFELPASVQALIGSDLPTIGLSDGSPLPAWIRFNSATMRFEAQAVPDGAFPLQVLISTGRTTVLIAISERKE